MSAKTDALEAAVTALLQAKSACEAAPGPRNRALIDRAFARLAQLAAPRVRYFIARYGLTDLAEDAEQACAIALHRAVESYNPRRAKFTTFVNWQLRGELQDLRYRMRADQRSPARKLAATTVSLDAMAAEDGDWFDAMIADPDAETATERRAADLLTSRIADRLADDWSERRRASLMRRSCRPGTIAASAIDRMEEKLAAERALVRHHLTATELGAPGRLRESDRHILRRALSDIDMHAAGEKMN